MHLLCDVLYNLSYTQEEVGFDYVVLLLAFDKKDNQVLCNPLSFFAKVHNIANVNMIMDPTIELNA